GVSVRGGTPRGACGAGGRPDRPPQERGLAGAQGRIRRSCPRRNTCRSACQAQAASGDVTRWRGASIMNTISIETENRPLAEWLPREDSEEVVYLTRGGRTKFVVVPLDEGDEEILAMQRNDKL